MRALDGHWGVLGGLGIQADRDLPSIGAPRHFDPGEPLFPNVLLPRAPAASHTVLITDGLTRLTASDGGRETILSIHGPGDLLGEQDAIRRLTGDRYSRVTAGDMHMTAIALTPVTARAIPPAAMCQFLDSHPKVLATVALELSERLEEAALRIASAGRENADQRLARLLCDLERYGTAHEGPGGPAGTRIPLMLTHAELAAWIGTCPETVGRTLRRWRARHIVSTRQRTLIIHDLETVARIAGIRLSRHALNWPPAVAADPGPSILGDSAAYAAPVRRRLGQGLGQLIPALR
jgi:CRP-like cAMP-binding protein